MFSLFLYSRMVETDCQESRLSTPKKGKNAVIVDARSEDQCLLFLWGNIYIFTNIEMPASLTSIFSNGLSFRISVHWAMLLGYE